jgi:hypothetical protein
MHMAKYYATLDRNGTEDEITIITPEGRAMLCVGFWDAEWDDDPLKHNADQLKADALLIVDALNSYRKRRWWQRAFGPSKPAAIENAHLAVSPAIGAGIAPAEAERDIHALLAARRQIAIIWSVEDVREVRPDLDDDQCWEVLQRAGNQHDALIGLDWDMLEVHAEALFGLAPARDDGEEE